MTEKKKITENKEPVQSDEGLGLFDLLLQGLIGIPRLMRSLSFAIWVIIIMAVLTLAGTVLPQEHLSNDLVDFGMSYQALFDVDASDGINSFREFFYHYVVKRLELYNIFKSELYFTLLVLLTISASLCAWDRLWISKKILAKTDPTIKAERVRKMKHSFEGTISGDPDTAVDTLRSKLKKSGFQVFEKESEDGTICLFGRKNAFKLYASVAFHFALVFVLVGGLLGDDRTFAYDGSIALQEGEMRPLGSRQHSEWQAENQSKQFSPPFVPDYTEKIELIEYESIYRERDFGEINPESGFPVDFMAAPSDYISQLRIVRPNSSGEDEILADRKIQVNFPLRYGGIGYYQSSVNTLLTFTVTDPSGRESLVETFQYSEFSIPGVGFNAQIQGGDIVGGVWEALDGTQSPLPYAVRLVDYSAPMRGLAMNPVLLGFVREGVPLMIGDTEVRLDGIKEYSILTYRHDPGLPITYFGFLVLTIGITIALYLPFRTGRVVITRRKDGVEYVTGSAWDGFPEIFDRNSEK